MAIQPIHPYGHYQFAQPQPKRGIEKFFDTFANFLLEYWAHILTIVLGTLVFAALSVPFLSYFGLDSLSKSIFFALHYVCAQVPSHSFYVFGHQLGLCARNFSIYTSMFLGCLAFVLSKKKLPGIPWWIWVLMILPMALDGTTQMFGLRESDWILRLLTGTLFGLGNIWFALPLMQKTLLDTPPTPPLTYGRLQVARAGIPDITIQPAANPQPVQSNTPQIEEQ